MKPLMWLTVLPLAAFVAGCGSAGNGTAPEPVPGPAAIGGNSGDTLVQVTVQAATTTTSPDYGVWNDSSGCLTSRDLSYNSKLVQLAQSLFRLPAAPVAGVGCITEPYLANGYSFYASGLENHAGIDFQAPLETPAYAIHGGNVVHETLDIPNGHSTLVIESTVGNQTLQIYYLHCQSHNNQADRQLVTGMSVGEGELVCQTGNVNGTPVGPHLHLEVKIKGTDGDNLSALGGNDCNSTFIAFDNTSHAGCNLRDIRARTVDPIILITE